MWLGENAASNMFLVLNEFIFGIAENDICITFYQLKKIYIFIIIKTMKLNNLKK